MTMLLPQSHSYTKQQRRVIRTKRPFVEVQAFAGAGKTTILAARVEYLHSKGIPYDEMLGLSFSNGAVQTLRRKLPEGVLCRTFHSLGFGLICRYHAELGLPKRLSLIKKKAVPELIQEAIEHALNKLRGARRRHALELVDEHFSTNKGLLLLHDLFKLKRNGNTVKDVIKLRKRFDVLSDHVKLVRSVCRQYQSLKKERGLVEFDEMISLCQKLISHGIQLPFKHLIVDEYQDIPVAQQRLLKALCQMVPNVMVAGDRFQAIYGFLGGYYTSLNNLVDGAKTYSITQSFRLTRSNARFTNAVLRQVLGQNNAVIEGTSKKGSSPITIKCETPQAQSDIVVGRIKSLLDN